MDAMVQCLRVWQAIGIAILVSMLASGQARRILIAHRGASGYLRKHTVMAYAIAIAQGAEFIERRPSRQAPLGSCSEIE